MDCNATYLHLCQQFQKPNSYLAFLNVRLPKNSLRIQKSSCFYRTSKLDAPQIWEANNQNGRLLHPKHTSNQRGATRLFAKQLNDLETIIQSLQNPTKMQQTSKNHCKIHPKFHKKKSNRFWGFTAIIFMIFPYFHMPRYNRMSRDADSKGFKETWTAGLNRLGRGWFFSTKKPVIQLQVTRKPRKKTCLYVLLFFFSNLFRYFLIWLLLRGGHLVVGWLSKLRGRATPKGGGKMLSAISHWGSSTQIQGLESSSSSCCKASEVISQTVTKRFPLRDTPSGCYF